MIRVVVESPFAAPTARERRAFVGYARRCVADCLARGEAPIASHLLHTQPGILRDDRPEERAKGIAAGHAWIRVADRLVVYVNHGISAGMIEGIRVAHAAGTRISIRRLEHHVPAHAAWHCPLCVRLGIPPYAGGTCDLCLGVGTV